MQVIRLQFFIITLSLITACGGGGGGGGGGGTQTEDSRGSEDISQRDEGAQEGRDENSLSYLTVLQGDQDGDFLLGESLPDTIDWYRYTNSDCNVNEPSLCDDFFAASIPESTRDSFLGRNSNATYELSGSNGEFSTKFSTGVALRNTFSTLALFDDQIWRIGGVEYRKNNDKAESSGYTNEIWRTSDGVDWVRIRPESHFSERASPGIVEFLDSIWVIGGVDGSGYLSDIWASQNGYTWSRKASSSAFQGRQSPGLVVWNGALYLGGGYGVSGSYSDLWRSADGITWQQVSTNRSLPQYFGQTTLLVYNGQLCSFYEEQETVPLVYHCTADGISWEQYQGNYPSPVVLEDQLFQSNYSLGAVVFDDKAWQLNDNVPLSYPALYVSEDAQEWTSNAVSRGLNPSGVTVKLGGAFLQITGSAVYQSTDGLAWSLLTSAPDYKETSDSLRDFSVAVWNDQVWMFGGTGHDSGSEQNLWSSQDGASWSKAEVSIPARSLHTMFAFDDRLWVIGGMSSTGEVYRDVWYTTNGSDWQQASSPSFEARYGHTVTLMDGSLYLIGGRGITTNRYDDVWKSVDGINWTELQSDAAFAPRYEHAAAAYQGKLWVSGGKGAFANLYHDDLWSSTDGITWVEASSDTDFTGRYGHTLLNDAGLLWLFGGRDNNSGAQAPWVYRHGEGWYRGMVITVLGEVLQ